MGVKYVKKSHFADENRLFVYCVYFTYPPHQRTRSPSARDPNEEGFTPEGFLQIYIIYKYSMRVLPYIFVDRKRFVQKYKNQCVPSLVDNAILPFHFYKRIKKSFTRFV